MTARSLSLVVVGILSTGLLVGAMSAPSPARSVGVAEPDNGGAIATSSGAAAATRVSYNRDIRPLLSDRCFTCHGPDAQSRKADLRLDLPEEATKIRDGAAAIVPGDTSKSTMWARINSTKPGEVMPPPESEKQALSDADRALIRAWIESGAKYEPHWAFVPPVRPEVQTGRNPVDYFVDAKLAAHQLTRNPLADRASLARRAFLDLTGLPPTPSEVDAFITDDRADAYEQLLTRLMTQEPYQSRYAERMATPWLDQARYADTSGIHTDAGRSIWPYRDWVLEAYRNNMRFDQFAREQLAGDLLPDATIEQRIATGFNRNHVTSDEGGAIDEEYLLEYAVDRVSTTGSVFLGLTFGCARCHDHKYDPISMREFYSLIAYFNSIEEPGIYSQIPDSRRAFEPFLAVPSVEQTARLATLEARAADLRRTVSSPDAENSEQIQRLLAELRNAAGISWTTPSVVSATSSQGSTMTIREDQSVAVTGTNPDSDVYTLRLSANANDLRLLMLEALVEPDRNRPGRSGNGNAMLTGVEVAVIGSDGSRRPVGLQWTWADVEQKNGDFWAAALLHTGTDRGWALDGHNSEGRRTLLLLADRSFSLGVEDRLEVTLRHESPYARHGLNRVRIRVSPMNSEGLAKLPVTAGSWYQAGPFGDLSGDLFDEAFGPESPGAFAFDRAFEPGVSGWKLDTSIQEGVAKSLTDGANVTYVAHRMYAPSARELPILLGSDDGIRVFVNGEEMFSNRISRSITVDSDRAALRLREGANDVVFKVVNTGGMGAFSHRVVSLPGTLEHDLVAGLLPQDSLSEATTSRMAMSWNRSFSPKYKAAADDLAATEKAMKDLAAEIPRTMVMSERMKARETFVMTRGQYDHPDKNQLVSRGLPAALGARPEQAGTDRRGLADWIVGDANPLTARVTINRLWAQFFGLGLVRTGEDFGLQGEFPSHPELLDWLAVEFRESGWDVQHMIRIIMTSETYRQSSRVNLAAKEIDSDNRMLAWFPRQRISAEQARDSALAISGLLREKFGGPPVKPYQPAGLWEEVSMPASNTKSYQQDMGESLYRRSLYTYWKRASPPPSMQVFDAPTRESCVTQRLTTNTPLQALVLWNDPQFVEAARLLATSVLHEPIRSDAERMTAMFRRVTGEHVSSANLSILLDALADFRTRYEAAPEDARKLIAVGATPLPADLPEAQMPELAAWTMIANSVLSTDSFLIKD